MKETSTLLSKIAIGTVQFGLDYGISNKIGQTTLKEAKEILLHAYQSGIRTLDTAQAYGSSEDTLGKIGVANWNTITKINPRDSNTNVLELVSNSMTKIGLSHIYAVLFHNANIVLNNIGLIEQLKEIREGGRISKIGYSVYSTQELEKLIDKVGLPDIVQVPFNYLDRKFTNLLILLKNQGVEIHTRSAFLQGLFFMRPDDLNSFFDPVKPFLKELNTVCPTSVEKVSFLLNFVLRQTFIDKVVIGTNSVDQLKDNLKAVSMQIPYTAIPIGDIPEKITSPNLWP